MDRKEVEKLIKGVGVIIDDDAEKPGNSVDVMIQSIQNAGIPLAVYASIPDHAVIDSFGSISFIILDWDFTPQLIKTMPGVFLGEEGQKGIKRTILDFLRELLKRVFVPVFIITGQTFSEVESELSDAGLYNPNGPMRIMLKQKEEVKNYATLVSSIQEWLEKTPSAYALKIWGKDAETAKNEMFLDLYQASPGWVSVLQKSLEEDSENNIKAVNHDFGKLLSNIFSNRMNDGGYYDIPRFGGNEPDADEIRKVLQGERYIKYGKDNLPDISYVGDLYQETGKDIYWLNIRAECDVIRVEDPVLYLIKGETLSVSEITSLPRIKMKKNNKSNNIIIDRQVFPVEELQSYDKPQIGNFNDEMQKFEKKLLFIKGEIIQKKTHAIITCIADKYVIEFSFKDFIIEAKSSLEEKYERIGRIIPPYINKVQNEFSSFIVRQGLMPIPENLVLSK